MIKGVSPEFEPPPPKEVQNEFGKKVVPILMEPEEELCFKGPFHAITSAKIGVINKLNTSLYCRVLISNAPVFCANPKYFKLKPKEGKCIKVEMNVIDNLEPLMKKKNKIMIEYAESKELTLPHEDFWASHKGDGFMKLKVAFA